MPSGSAMCSSIAAGRGFAVECHAPAEEAVRVDDPEHDVGVGDRRPGAAASVADRAGIGARALGPDAEQPVARRVAIEPPPAPIAVMSTIGVATWYFATSVTPETTGRPSRISPTSKLVPPMSVVITLRWPSSSARYREPITPPVGPAGEQQDGALPRPRAAPITPPIELEHAERAREPPLAQAVLEPLEVALHDAARGSC